MSKLTDIVAYTYCADTYCPDCIIGKVRPRVGYGPFDYNTDPEIVLDQIALANGVDRYDERTYDSGDFPKVVFRDQIEPDSEGHPAQCGGCGKDL